MLKKILKALDYSIIIFSLALFIIGIIALYSANGGAEGDTAETMKQIAWMGVGIVTMIVIIFIDYDILRKTMGAIICYYCISSHSSTFHNSNKWCN